MINKKLLVLDVNGLLVDTYFHKEPRPDESPDARVGNFYVYKRPFCEKFLEFCLENFTVGLWSSAREHNVNKLVDYVFGHTKEKLAFTWHQTDCTDVGLKSPDNQFKPLFLKELSKLWKTVKEGLPWSEGDYGPSNTLLVDDTPYKAILNPPNTAIFPRSYTARDQGDDFLGGALRSYLEGLRDASSVQAYVECNPFGEPSITPASPLWSYVSEVVLKAQNALNVLADGIAQNMSGEVVNDKSSNEDNKINSWQMGKGKHPSDLSKSDEVISNNGKNKGNHESWKNKKQKHNSYLLQVAVPHAQFSAFPCESVEMQTNELQFRGNMLEPSESDAGVHDSDSCHPHVHETSNLGSQDQGCSHSNQPFEDRPPEVLNRISLFSGPDEPFKGQQDGYTSYLELDNRNQAGGKHCDKVGVSFLEWGHHGAHEPASQSPANEHGDLKGFDKKHEQVNKGSSSHYENKHLEKSHVPISHSVLDASELDCMQRERKSGEDLCGRLEMSDTVAACGSKDNYASQHHLMFGHHILPKHTGFGKQQDKWHISRNNASSFRDDYGRKSEGEHHRYLRNMDQRWNHGMDQKQTTNKDWHKSGRGKRNRPSCKYDRQQYKSWGDDPVDASTQFSRASLVPDSRNWVPSQQDCRQAMINQGFSTSANMQAPGSNWSTWPSHEVSTLPFDSHMDTAGRIVTYNEHSRGQDGGPSYTGHQSFHPGPVYESSGFWPERSEHLNADVHKPDYWWWDGKRQCLDYSWGEAGASSKPYANVGAYGQHHGGTRQPYQNVSASSQQYWTAGARKPYRDQHIASRGLLRDPRDSRRLHY